MSKRTSTDRPKGPKQEQTVISTTRSGASYKRSDVAKDQSCAHQSHFHGGYALPLEIIQRIMTMIEPKYAANFCLVSRQAYADRHLMPRRPFVLYCHSRRTTKLWQNLGRLRDEWRPPTYNVQSYSAIDLSRPSAAADAMLRSPSQRQRANKLSVIPHYGTSDTNRTDLSKSEISTLQSHIANLPNLYSLRVDIKDFRFTREWFRGFPRLVDLQITLWYETDLNALHHLPIKRLGLVDNRHWLLGVRDTLGHLPRLTHLVYAYYSDRTISIDRETVPNITHLCLRSTQHHRDASDRIVNFPLPDGLEVLSLQNISVDQGTSQECSRLRHLHLVDCPMARSNLRLPHLETLEVINSHCEDGFLKYCRFPKLQHYLEHTEKKPCCMHDGRVNLDKTFYAPLSLQTVVLVHEDEQGRLFRTRQGRTAGLVTRLASENEGSSLSHLRVHVPLSSKLDVRDIVADIQQADLQKKFIQSRICAWHDDPFLRSESHGNGFGNAYFWHDMSPRYAVSQLRYAHALG